MSRTAIKVEGLGKKFDIGHQVQGDLRASLMSKIQRLLGKTATSKEEFWALKDVSFEIKQGEAVGIIGRNGAGKSTLLKILSRITEPTTGRFEINGRVSSLLEVGTGFHPELTGRENIYLNGTILGMKRQEIKTKFDEIVDFSGVEKFIDTPVKHYSSGMKVRLAFSVAAHLEPEILIIDEVLAVGDAEFQKKCLGKMDDVSKNDGRTILFVSHDMPAVTNLCTQAILLNNGTVQDFDAVEKITSQYLYNTSSQKELAFPENDSPISFISFNSFAIESVTKQRKSSSDLLVGHPAGFRMMIQNKTKLKRNLFFAITIINNRGHKVFTLDNLYTNKPLEIPADVCTVECTLEEVQLLPDTYFVNLWCSDGYETFQNLDRVFSFSVEQTDIFGTGKMYSPKQHGVIFVKSNWSLND